MENYSFYSYMSAAVGYFLLLILAMFRIKKKPANILFVIATSTSLLWSGYIAFTLKAPIIFISDTLPFETLNYAAWIVFLIVLILQQQFNSRYKLLLKYWQTYALLLLITMVFFLELFADNIQIARQYTGYDFLFFAHTSFAVVGLVLIEQLFRNGITEQRWSVKYLFLGLGTLFTIDFALYSKSLLYIRLDFGIWDSRGFIHAMVMPLLAITLKRLDHSESELTVSRQVVFHTTVLLATGIYLIFMSLAGYYIRDYGGTWGAIAQTVFISLSILILLIVLLSRKIRAQAKVYFNKHFFQYNYDYREEWLKLSKTIAGLNSLSELSGLIIKTMADLAGSTGGALWLKNEQDHYYLANEYNLGFQTKPLVRSTDPVVRFLIQKQWVIDFVEYNDDPDIYKVDLSPWLSNSKQKAWLVIPLVSQQEMLAFVVLSKALVPRKLNWEDRDLLKNVAMQLSNALALSHASDELSRSRQFEAYNQLSAYLVHDLKNLVAQVALIVKNAEKHKRNPDFIDDSIDTLKNVSTKLQYLVGQLKKGNLLSSDEGSIDLVDIVQDVVVQQAGNKPQLKSIVNAKECRVKGEREKMTSILGHLVQNAQEATEDGGWVYLELHRDQNEAIIKVIDNGEGMDSKFISERLFKPFDTTKGNAGMGVGVYETRDYIVKQSGKISVDSTPGQGTIFTIKLPLTQA